MGKNEKTSQKIATLASKVLSGDKKPTKKEILSLAATALTQAPNKHLNKYFKVMQSAYRRKG